MYKRIFLMLMIILLVNVTYISSVKLRRLINKNSKHSVEVEVQSLWMFVEKMRGREPAYYNKVSVNEDGFSRELNVVIVPGDTLFIDNKNIEIEHDELLFDLEVEGDQINIIPVESIESMV